MSVPPPQNNEDPVDRGGVSVVSAYSLRKFPLFKFILFCVDDQEFYDFILVKTVSWEGELKKMEEYRLIGDPDVYGEAYEWTPDKGWERIEVEEPVAHDIKDCYSLACKYQHKDWKVVSD